MKKNELNFYDEIGNWDFSMIKRQTERLTDWDFYEKIRENTNEKSLCLDLGTGGGEKVLNLYPDVGMIIASDNSKEMLKTAKNNAKKYPNKKIKFVWMDNVDMKFPAETFDLISARHTIIDAKQILDCLSDGGTLIIEGIAQKDCWDIKQLFGRGQGYRDEISISEKDYKDLVDTGFSFVKKFEISENEYYQTEEDLMALLLKTPILNDFSEITEETIKPNKVIEKDLFDKYVKKYKTDKGILLKRVLYGIIAKK